MKDIKDYIDDFGPEKILVVSDPKVRMIGYIVIDNTARGMGKGGTRMAPDLTLETVIRLARAMTWKWALADINLGGAKAGIVADPNSPNKEQILRAFAKKARCLIPSEYVCGLDMGMSEKDVAKIVDELDDMKASIGKSEWLGGLPYDKWGLAGYGVAEATEALCEFYGWDIKEKKIAIQGFGANGKAAAKFLYEKGASILAVSTIKGAIYDPNGLDIVKLLDLQEKYGDDCVTKYTDAQRINLGEELFLDVDILIPAAKEDVITSSNVDRVRAKCIVEAANFPVTVEAEKVLHSRGVIILPDILANAGAVIGGAKAMLARYGPLRPEREEVYADITRKMKSNTKLILEKYEETHENPREIALNIAKRRVLKAMQERGRLTREMEEKYRDLLY